MNLLLSILWDVDPVAFSLFQIDFKWYGMMYALAFISCYFLVGYWFRKDGLPLNKLANLSIGFLIIGIIGARLGQFIFYDWKLLLSDPSILFKINKGGMASHGAFITYVIFSYLYCRFNKEFNFWWIMDKLAIAGALIVFFMRIGNLFNSEIIGKESDLPWAFVFSKKDLIPRHPTVLYEAIAYLVLFFLFFWIDHKYPKLKKGLLTAAFLLILVPVRMILEFTKENAAYTQSLSSALIIFGIFILGYRLKSVKSLG